MSQNELLPCPFFGCEAELDQCNDGSNADLKWAVGCITVGCNAWGGRYIHDRKCEAAAAWHRRIESLAAHRGEPVAWVSQAALKSLKSYGSGEFADYVAAWSAANGDKTIPLYLRPGDVIGPDDLTEANEYAWIDLFTADQMRAASEDLRRQLAEAQKLLATRVESSRLDEAIDRAEVAEAKLVLAEQDVRRYRWNAVKARRELATVKAQSSELIGDLICLVKAMYVLGDIGNAYYNGRLMQDVICDLIAAENASEMQAALSVRIVTAREGKS